MSRLFGTDGVRGIANDELTIELAMALGKYGAHVITQGKERAKILVGKDTRISGDLLEYALISGILSTGCDVIRVGVIPTPAIAKLVKVLEADAGVMISASHNPVAFNGIKFFNALGLKLSDEIEDEIETCIQEKKEIGLPIGFNLGHVKEYVDAETEYIDYVTNTLEGMTFEGIKVAMDCANGAASVVAPKTLNALNAKVYSIHHEPDGININENCGSTHMNDLKKFVTVVGADIGLAFDGDADRLLAIDENGDFVDGDKIMAICGNYLTQKGKLKDATIVSTVMSNLGFDIALSENNMRAVKTQVGDRYVLEAMLANGFGLGGEQSGHIIFLEHNTTGDGLLTAVQLLRVMKDSGKKLSELASIMNVYPQVLKNAKVPNDKKYHFAENKVISERIDEIEKLFHGKGRVLIRPSGTEPLVRVMIEGENQAFLEKISIELADLIEREMN
ncbi:phosphoglucosamine mutase [Fusibacter bizertensis]|uniref:Phosphoglucosamine mutase n=1 Tax=Fusibacter bizertensis TaxID=1488331 RepID=A0ABT6NHM5_9FIRM|nr:phosphoglucosamine mutase [Fusibacter bizertensis]MDH8679843.1 phosphoglucosamine mutase [Fusibacter bizertensis]